MTAVSLPSSPSAPASAIAWPNAHREAAFWRWLQPLADAHGLRVDTLAAASADASFRRYFRLQAQDGSSRIVMDAPPPQEDVRPFIDMARRIQAAGLHAPAVLAADEPLGFVLMADLGSELYLHSLQTADTVQIETMMRDAVSALVQFQTRVDGSGLPAYDEELLRRELALFPEWCVAKEFGISWTPAQTAVWNRLCDSLVASALAQPQTTVHRDWMPRNLMVTSPNPGILDFQDAVRGPVTYDMASLLRDAFISWDEAQEIDWTARWWTQARAAGLLGDHAMATDFGECWRALEWIGLQRHLKVMGIFCRLKHRDSKPTYSADLPRFLAYAGKVALRYRELKPLIALIEPMSDKLGGAPLTVTGFSMR